MSAIESAMRPAGGIILIFALTVACGHPRNCARRAPQQQKLGGHRTAEPAQTPKARLEPAANGSASNENFDCSTGRAASMTESGRVAFEKYCAACHQPDGAGMVGGAPPLANSSWVSGPPARLIRIVLHGVRGPIAVHQTTYNLEMPGFGQVMTDAEVARVLTYIRTRFGGIPEAIAPEAVRTVRAITEERTGYWTAEELLEIP